MSLFFGLWEWDGRPVTDADLAVMQQAHAHVPSDARGIWQDGDFGSGIICQYQTPESPYEIFPQQSRCGCHTIIAHARLDNREELLRLLAVPAERQRVTPDTTLVSMAYDCWGEAFVERLAGDWSCVVRSKDQRRLFLALAPTGNGALFYATKGSRFAFSSTPHGLLALPWLSRTPDLQALGLYVSGALDQVSGSGFFKDVHALPPAHILVVEPDRLALRRYWRPERRTSLKLKDDREYYQAFLEQYQRAVTCRLRSYRGVGATLSGGLDSGSVVALAAKALRSSGSTLPVFSAVPNYSLNGCVPAGRCGDETPYVQATADMVGNVAVHFLRSATLTPTGSIGALTAINGAPVIGAVNSFWMHELLMQAHQQRLRVLLTGQGGNGTVSWNGSNYCWDYLGDPTSVLPMIQWLRGQGIARGGKSLLRSMLPIGALRGIMLLRGQSAASHGFLTHTFLRQEFMDTIPLREHFDRLDTLVMHNSRQMRQALIETTVSNGGKFWSLAGAAHGVDVRDPTMDKELIDFLFSLPENQYHRSNENRRLIRHAMADLLPHTVRYPEERGLQGADIIQRIRASADEVFATLTRLERHDVVCGVLDLDAMRCLAVRLLDESSPELTLLCGSLLCRGLSVGLFLNGCQSGCSQ